ncbi:S8 family serine peptidase [Aneurinibacillus sp. Ricciae_BoGa-3]|uniref:S8 family peptidase n=1 Tax=Aneurinibacillus sp. Ricciae_BoGa-3 TaxID=3022697 RepID=UPI0023422CF5|nr:S8 family peptidase [Aneurinibacillus sp. Ricciae_BoGa-3]WCK54271.1 S8 family serine peptidase [Aneurinibacillus sp. Ricciae_BoGa-3]
MRKWFSFFLVLLMFMATIPFHAEAAPSSMGRYIVHFKNKADKNLITNAKGNIHYQFASIPALAVSVPQEAIQGLLHNPNVADVEPDQIVHVNGQVTDWGMDKVAAPYAWNSAYTGKGVKVAVVDTGVAAHEDLTVAGGTSFVSYTTSYADDNGHGTHVAGIIGAKRNTLGVAGVAPDASVYAVKVMDNTGSGYLSDIVSGIDWSITNHMDIINLSLGTSTDSLAFHQVIDKAYNNNILVVAAAGNNGTADGSGDTVQYPARYDSAIAVAAVDSNNQRASFSATGSKVEVAAPGVNVLSTYLNNSYAPLNGTSMATPFVAGDLALLKQANPTLSATSLRTKLQQTATDLGTPGRDTFYGFGLIKAPYGSVPAQTGTTISTSVLTNQHTYVAGNEVDMYVKAQGPGLLPLNAASAKVTITTPTGAVYTGTAVTDATGETVFSLGTDATSAKGTYYVKATASKSGYTAGTDTISFTLQ